MSTTKHRAPCTDGDVCGEPAHCPPGSGAELIAAERERQVTAEDWTPEHDAGHTSGELALAGALYAIPFPARKGHVNLWPWGEGYWKPTSDDRVRELVKAGALIAAEIDRLNAAEVTR